MSESARFNMVEAQIRSADVTDPRILAAMEAVAREKFVPRAGHAPWPMPTCRWRWRQGRYLLDPR